MDVDARLWRSFAALADELHYGRAADRLHISVGHQLTLQLAWAADNANTALAGFLETAHQIVGRPTPPVLPARQGPNTSSPT